MGIPNFTPKQPRNLMEGLEYLKTHPGCHLVVNEYVQMRRCHVEDMQTGKKYDSIDINCHIHPARRHAWLPVGTANEQIVHCCTEMVLDCLTEAKNSIVEDLERGVYEYCGNY